MIELDNIVGVVQLCSETHHDHRGEIQTIWGRDHNKLPPFVEDKISVSRHNVLRGLHGDNCTGKLLACLSGAVYVAIVDARIDSDTYGNWAAVTLDDKRRNQIYIPPGILNGHYCLTDNCIFWYKLTTAYSGPQAQVTVSWDDRELGIWWPTAAPMLSRRDAVGCTPFQGIPKWPK